MLLYFSNAHDSKGFNKEITLILQCIEQSNNKEKLLNYLLMFESTLHNHRSQDVLICIKRNLGTNELSQLFLSQMRMEGFFSRILKGLKECCPIFHRQSQNQLVVAKLWIFWKNFIFSIGQISFVYVDLIKDTILIMLLFQTTKLNENVNSFSNQIIILSTASVLLPLLTNSAILIFQIVTKKINKMVGITLIGINFVAPSVALYASNRLKGKNETIMREMKQHSCKENILISQTKILYQSKIQDWNFLSLVFKMNEKLFENTIQIFLLLFITLSKFSTSNTVSGLEKLFSADEIEYFTVSGLFSVFSLVLGFVNWQVGIKNNFLPMKGKGILYIYYWLSLTTRILAIVIYFTPSLGLFNILSHWKMGFLKVANAAAIYNMEYNGTINKFIDKWKRIENYSELTIYELEKYFKAFLLFTIIHLIVTGVIKYLFVSKFQSFRLFFKKFYHILMNFTCPISYMDWDDEIVSNKDVENNWREVAKEMKILLGLFSLEHILLCVPMWILSYNISQRNIFLDEFFPQVVEEQKATYLANTLSIMCPIVFVIVPFLQYELFVLYNKYGHPWSAILNGEDYFKLTGRVYETKQQVFYSGLLYFSKHSW